METKNSFKERTISSFKWGFIDNISYQLITFFVGVILARLLSPAEFGLIGMITIVIAISQAFIDSGFSQALIRKQNCTDEDYSTVFIFNFFAGLIFYVVIFFAAPLISDFYNEPELTDILKVLGLNLLINAIAQIQRTIRTKRLDFKLQTKISILSTIGSGIIGIYMAYNGYGVWSLVWKTLLQNIISSALLWYWNNWKPVFTFNIKSFKEMFGFGSKLLISGLIDTIYRNIYYLIIGKYFSAAELGYYTRADAFKKLPSENITTVVQRISYPVLSTINEDNKALKNAYKKLISTTMFATFILMLGLAATAESVVLLLVGIKWQPTVIYLQLLCFAGMLYPLHALNLNMLKVKGRSDLFLKIEIIKKILAVPVIVIGIFFGIKFMIVAMILNSFIAYFINSYWSGILIDYNIKEQLKDIAPGFVISLAMAVLTYSIEYLYNSNEMILLIFQLIFAALFILIVSELTKFETYFDLKSLIFKKKII